MADRPLDPELERLRDEVRAKREGVRTTLASCRAEARDPLRLGARVRANPAVAAGVAAGAGFFIVQYLRARANRPAKDGSEGAHAPGWLRDVAGTAATSAVKAFGPIAASFVAEQLAGRTAENGHDEEDDGA